VTCNYKSCCISPQLHLIHTKQLRIPPPFRVSSTVVCYGVRSLALPRFDCPHTPHAYILRLYFLASSCLQSLGGLAISFLSFHFVFCAYMFSVFSTFCAYSIGCVSMFPVFGEQKMVQRLQDIVSEHDDRLRTMQLVPRFSYGSGLRRKDGAPNRMFVTFLFGR